MGKHKHGKDSVGLPHGPGVGVLLLNSPSAALALARIVPGGGHTRYGSLSSTLLELYHLCQREGALLCGLAKEQAAQWVAMQQARLPIPSFFSRTTGLQITCEAMCRAVLPEVAPLLQPFVEQVAAQGKVSTGSKSKKRLPFRSKKEGKGGKEKEKEKETESPLLLLMCELGRLLQGQELLRALVGEEQGGVGALALGALRAELETIKRTGGDVPVGDAHSMSMDFILGCILQPCMQVVLQGRKAGKRKKEYEANCQSVLDSLPLFGSHGEGAERAGAFAWAGEAQSLQKVRQAFHAYSSKYGPTWDKHYSLHLREERKSGPAVLEPEAVETEQALCLVLHKFRKKTGSKLGSVDDLETRGVVKEVLEKVEERVGREGKAIKGMLARKVRDDYAELATEQDGVSVDGVEVSDEPVRATEVEESKGRRGRRGELGEERKQRESRMSLMIKSAFRGDSQRDLQLSSPVPVSTSSNFRLSEDLVWDVDDDPLLAFELKKCMGAGGMGAVYRARHQATGADVAIKILACPVFKENVTDFKSEIDLLRAAQHPNIVTYYGLCVVGRYAWLIMELAAGGSVMDFREHIAPRQLKEKHLTAILQQTLRAVTYLHSHRIVHRDIKGQNLLLTARAVVKLADFGLAMSEEDGSSDLCGSAHWMSPDVWVHALDDAPPLREVQNIWSTAADIWAIGITAIELTVGQPPHWALGAKELRERIAGGPPPTLEDEMTSLAAAKEWSKPGGGFSKAYCDLVRQCLSQDPAARPSAAALLEHQALSRAPADLLQTPLFSGAFRKRAEANMRTPVRKKEGERVEGSLDTMQWAEDKVKSANEEAGGDTALREETLGLLLGKPQEEERASSAVEDERMPLLGAQAGSGQQEGGEEGCCNCSIM